MSRRLLIVNILLGALSCLFAVALIRDLRVAPPLPAPPALRATLPASAPTPTAAAAPLASYGVIAAKTLFNPSRSEVAAAAAVAGPKPVLHGVVVDGEKSRAYLEDPVAKRVFGYAVGDSIGSGRLQAISPDRVVIAGPEGTVEVLLQDPSKPKPAAVPPPSAAGSPDRSPTPTIAPAPSTLPAPPSPSTASPDRPSTPTTAPAPSTLQAPPGVPAAPASPRPKRYLN